MAGIVISDAGPLIALVSIDALSVLRNLFAQVYITDSVKFECSGKSGPDSQRIDAAVLEGWLVVSSSGTLTKPLSPGLGVGESDSIRLALKAPDESLLIMDDRLARRFALKQGINIIGTVRLLDIAERRGLITSAEQSIAEMAGCGYRVSVELLKQIRMQ